MDGIDYYIWQRRIHQGVRNQKCAVPFPESVEIGLEFNAALERKEKLDLSLLTNGVMMELSAFAKTVSRSEKYFLFEILHFNFNLDVDEDDDRQLYEYASKVHYRIKALKEQLKVKPRRWTETFPLPDRKAIMTFIGAKQSGSYYLKRNNIVDTSLLTDDSRSCQYSENQKTESKRAVSSVPVIKKRGGVKFKLTAKSYPFCKGLGVTLFVRPDGAPKEKLDPNLVTNGVMMELLDFSRVLCGTLTGVVHGIVKQNFGYELDTVQFHMNMSKVMERKNAYITAEEKHALRKEPFKLQVKKLEQNRKKRRNPDPVHREMEKLTRDSKRRMPNDKEICQDSDLSYMCPVDFESEMLSETEEGPEEMKSESCSSGTAAGTELALSLDIKEEDFVSPVSSETDGHKSSLFNLPSKITALEVSDLFSEVEDEDINVKTLKQKLWTRRAPRSKQILKSSRVNDLFARCRERGLDFNVGSGKKQKLDLQLLTNFVLFEIYRFATAMSKSLRSFLLDILEKNFNLVLQDELHQRNFLFYIITKEKILQNHPARQKMEFLNSPFKFPEVYNMVDVTSDFQTAEDADTEQHTNQDSSEPASSQQADMESHPFCNKLGLNLWSTEPLAASQKLDLTVLTTGAALEILSFVRELCGDVREEVNDILEHNFDLDLESGVTTAARVIQRWYATQRSLMKKQHTSPKLRMWLNLVVPVDGQPQVIRQPQTRKRPKDVDAEDVGLEEEMEALSEDVQQVKMVNHYHICKEIGLDLDIRSKSETKTKLDLGLLTRGVLYEMHQYVEHNCKRYVPSLYEILEYNFDLSSQKHRKVEFAWSLASQVIAIAGKHNRKGDYLNKVFELPFEVSESSQVDCKEEPDNGFGELDLNDNSDIMFVRELRPVDIEVEVE